MTPLSKRLCKTLSDHLEGSSTPPPEGSVVLWNGFNELSQARSLGSAGPNPISYADIASWASLMRVPLAPHHVEALIDMDRVWMQHVYTKEERDTVVGDLTPEAFDAVVGTTSL